MSSLRARAIRGIGVLGGLQIFRTFIAFFVSILLYRLLSAKDFGLFALCEMYFIFLLILSDMGMENVVTQHPRSAEPKVLQTGFFIRIFFTLASFAALFFGAGWISRFTANADAERPLRFIAANLFVNLITFKPEVVLKKKLEFEKFILPEIISSLSSAVISVTLALLGFHYWSLFVASVMNQVFRAAALLRISPQRWRGTWEGALVGPFLQKGLYNFFTKVLYYALPHVVYFFVAKILGVSVLGFYYLAFNWANVFVTYVVQLFGRVVFPAVATVESDLAHVKEIFDEYVTRLSLLAAPLSAGLAMLAGLLIPFVLGGKWEPSVLPCRILCLYGYAGILFGSSLIVLQSLGEFKKILDCLVLEFLVFLVLIYPASTHFGLAGVAWVMTTSKTVGTILMVHALAKKLKTSWRHVLKVIAPSLICSLAMAGLLGGLRGWMIQRSVSVLPQLIVSVASGILFYFALYFLIHPRGRGEMKTILRDFAILFGK